MSEEFEIMLQDAVEALRQGERQRARDMLTRLLKEDQKNAEVWVWLSAAMDTQKERLYCLQTALKLDSENTAAKRGLVLLGALPADDSIPPFPMNRPRPWEETAVLTEDLDKPRGFKGFITSPVGRLIGITGAGILMIGAIIYFTLQNSSGIRPFRYVSTSTPGPSPTPSMTPTLVSSEPQATPDIVGPTPLSAFLDATYTPTPLYVDTPHPGTEAYKAGLRFFVSGDYGNAIQLFQQLLTNEPSAVDGYYYIGQSYLRLGQTRQALDAFQDGIDINSNFAPNYLGRALARLAIDEKANIESDLSEAIRLDSNYLEAYLERGAFYLSKNLTDDALDDFTTAVDIAPNSPLAYLGLARAQIALGNPADAVEAAEQAKSLDITLLDAYLALGQSYVADERLTDAIEALRIYTIYVNDDVNAFITLAAGQNEAGNFEDALDAANSAVRLAPRLWEAYYQRGQAYLGLKDAERALEDYDYAFTLNNKSYEAGIGAGKALILAEDWNNAYVRIIEVEGLVDTNTQQAEFWYYRALSLDGIGENDIAYRDWNNILNLPEEDVPADLRKIAQERAFAFRTPTPTQFVSPTPLGSTTPTPRVSSTPSENTSPTATPTPTP